MSILTDGELADGAKGQAQEWRVNVRGSAQRETRTNLPRGPGIASSYETGGEAIMVPPQDKSATAPRGRSA